ncbi:MULTISPECIES: DUF4331 family protein [Zobellia]|uniref:DUF4331 family protein n=1 Tax=Zobellia TaxID=112040 RepID=UPI001FE67A3D|nr:MULTISPECIES: DUF4331 family protein [Zobellia]
MKLHTLKYMFLSLCAATMFVACDDDDALEMVETSCTDGVMNGTETGVDCGGTSCQPCEDGGGDGDGGDGMMVTPPDFSGTYAQVDFMGRPGINTVLSIPDFKDPYNQAVPSTIAEFYQKDFENRLEGLHDVYAELLGLNPEDVNYQPNILGDILNGPDKDGFTDNPVSAELLTTILANDVLEVAPDLPTTYFNPGTGAPNYEGAIGLTGRTLQDDVIDVSLILLFGGGDGARFNGQEVEGVGTFPRLVSDGVAFTAQPTDTFPYLGAPE